MSLTLSAFTIAALASPGRNKANSSEASPVRSTLNRDSGTATSRVELRTSYSGCFGTSIVHIDDVAGTPFRPGDPLARARELRHLLAQGRDLLVPGQARDQRPHTGLKLPQRHQTRSPSHCGERLSGSSRRKSRSSSLSVTLLVRKAIQTKYRPCPMAGEALARNTLASSSGFQILTIYFNLRERIWAKVLP